MPTQTLKVFSVNPRYVWQESTAYQEQGWQRKPLGSTDVIENATLRCNTNPFVTLSLGAFVSENHPLFSPLPGWAATRLPRSLVVKFFWLMKHRFLYGKRWTLLLACAALVAVILLAMVLRGVDFKPAQPFDFGGAQETDPGLPLALPWDRVIIVVIILVILALVFLLVPRETRKWVLVSFLCLAAFVFILYIIANASRAKVFLNQLPGINASLSPTPAYLTPQTSQLPTVFQPPAEFHPPQVSNLILYLVSFAVTLLLIFIVWMIYRWRQSRPSAVIFESLEEIGEAARLALDDLASGLDGENAVIRCYTRMNRVVKEKRGLQRDESMTAAEFAARLEEAGLPRDSVRSLTRLFESARYGAYGSQAVEIDEAKACLTAIARYCGEMI